MRLRQAAGNLNETDATLIADVLRHQSEQVGGDPGPGAHARHRRRRDPGGEAELFDCLYAVAAADHLVSDVEEREIRRVAEAILAVPHRVLMEIRPSSRDRLEVLQNLPRGR